MTIEIRQLVIRAEVVSSDRVAQTNSPGVLGRESRRWPGEPRDTEPPRAELRLEEIVEACVRQVLRRLERHHDR